ncbi:MAG: PA2779 family protein [Chromatiales bacterium]|nr:PA2779 family protein [Chromatiales bacterium]
MSLMNKMKRLISMLLVAAMIGGQAMPLQAAMIGTDSVMQQQQLQYDREQLVELLDRAEMQQQLQAMGVDSEQAKERVAQMTDSEVQQLNAQLNELPAGGSAAGVILFILLIFIITDIIGATDIFPFIDPVR